MPQNGNQIIGLFFSYSAQFESVDAGVSASRQIQIQADSDFKIMNLTAALFNATDGSMHNAGSLPAGQLVTVQLTDTGSGSNLFDKAQPIANIAGSGNDPYILPMSRIMSANSQLSVSINNGTTTDGIGVYITLGGQKLFYSGS